MIDDNSELNYKKVLRVTDYKIVNCIIYCLHLYLLQFRQNWWAEITDLARITAEHL